MTLTEQVMAAIDMIAARCPTEARAAYKLRQVVAKSVRNPLVPKRFASLINDARGDTDAQFNQEELQTLGLALHELTQAQEEASGKPGPPKLYPIRVDLRIGPVEQEALEKLTGRTGEDRSEAIRRLIREANS